MIIDLSELKSVDQIRLAKTKELAAKLLDMQDVNNETIQLVGSRRVMARAGYVRCELPETTDYDFLIHPDSDIKLTLVELGFNRVVENKNSPYPFDIWLEAIWVHPVADIQIQERYRFWEYLDVLDSIDVAFYEKYLWKSWPNRIRTPSREEIMDTFNQLFRTYMANPSGQDLDKLLF